MNLMSNNLPLENAKVGDTICVIRHLGPIQLAVVEKITPSGRVTTKQGTFTPNGYMYGGRKDAWNRARARLATEDDIAGINRASIVRKIDLFRLWDKLSPDDLKIVSTIIQKHA
jgi:hypothetical protein